MKYIPKLEQNYLVTIIIISIAIIIFLIVNSAVSADFRHKKANEKDIKFVKSYIVHTRLDNKQVNIVVNSYLVNKTKLEYDANIMESKK